MKYQLLVFDWDGTLYDSSEHIVRCVQASAKQAGLKVPEAEAIRNNIGLSSMESIKRLFPGICFSEAEAFQAMYREAVSEKHGPTLFEGSEAVIKALYEAGYLLAIATGKGRVGLDRDLKALNLTHYFAATRCADESFSKPHPQMLLEILEALDVVPGKALMIGDTEYDMQLAENAGTDALAVTYGVHHPSRLAGVHVVGQLADIKVLPGLLASI